MGEASSMELSAVCTGGGSGIGRASSLALADRGVRVMVGDIDADGARETVRLIEQRGGAADWRQVDVADEAQVEEFVAAAVDVYGPLACAANVAGTHAGLGARTADVSVTDFDRQIAVNLRGMWLCVRAELRSMIGSGGGSIVNVSSVNGLTAAEQGAPYAVAKHGIRDSRLRRRGAARCTRCAVSPAPCSISASGWVRAAEGPAAARRPSRRLAARQPGAVVTRGGLRVAVVHPVR
jgi:NAD(P)-dependent dehydrogenase (short-subunit alcohol dehydrogenase family)